MRKVIYAGMLSFLMFCNNTSSRKPIAAEEADRDLLVSDVGIMNSHAGPECIHRTNSYQRKL